MLKNQTTNGRFVISVLPQKGDGMKKIHVNMFHTRFGLLPFLTSKNTYISIRDKNRFPKKTLVSTLVSFNPRNVLLVFRLILVHGKITHPDSANEVLDLFFKGETPPHVSADGYWNFSVKLEIHPMVLSKKTRRCETSPRLCALP